MCQASDSNHSWLLLAGVYSVQAAILSEQAEMKAAIILQERALEIRENVATARVLDQHHTNRANSFTNLGVSVAHFDTAKAIALHQNTLEIRHGSTKIAKVQVQGLALNHKCIRRSWLEVGKLDKSAAAIKDCIAIIKPEEWKTDLSFSLYVYSQISPNLLITLLTDPQEWPGPCGPNGTSNYIKTTSTKRSYCTQEYRTSWCYTRPSKFPSLMGSLSPRLKVAAIESTIHD